jgi:pimeloyl-ACP methyl ester carboxylesterase
VTVGGLKLAFETYEPLEPNGQGVLFIHGWRSSKHSLAVYAKALSTAGYTCLSFDMGGMGDSEGNADQLSRAEYLEQCLAAYDQLAKLPNAHPITVIGSSFGSYLACLVSAARPVKALALRVPADYPDDDFDEPKMKLNDAINMGKWRLLPDVEDSRSVDALRHFMGPVLIVESGKDELIPHICVDRYVKAVPDARLTYVLMKSAPHSISHHPELQKEYLGALDHWLSTVYMQK